MFNTVILLLLGSLVPIEQLYPPLSPFSTRRLFSREATFSFVGVAYHISKCDADKGKSRSARKTSPSGKRALESFRLTFFLDNRKPLETT